MRSHWTHELSGLPPPPPSRTGVLPAERHRAVRQRLIDKRASNSVRRTAGVVTAEDTIAMLEPGSILIDCTGSRSLLRDHLTEGPDGLDTDANTVKVRLEYALVITFLYGQPYDCNEYCKYYKNIENARYKFIPQQGPLRVARRPVRAPGEAAHLLAVPERPGDRLGSGLRSPQPQDLREYRLFMVVRNLPYVDRHSTVFWSQRPQSRLIRSHHRTDENRRRCPAYGDVSLL
jgi:hypothetical protein